VASGLMTNENLEYTENGTIKTIEYDDQDKETANGFRNYIALP
jgi:hypothetical protein